MCLKIILNKKVSAYILLICLAIPFNVFASSQEDQLLAALALNYCRDSLVKIISYNDRIVLDEEYNNIINNIDLSKIEDEEIIDLLQDLMDTLTEFKLQENVKERIYKKYERNVSNAFYASFSPSNILYLGGGNPYTMAVAAITEIGGSYANYRKNRQKYQDELDEGIWKLQDDALVELNDIEKEFLKASWILMKRYEIPDEWRLTNLQLKDYVEALKDSDSKRKLRKLEKMSNIFNAYPPYWYYLGITYLDVKKNDKALEALNRFEEIRKGFFRQDHIYTSALMNKILLLDKNDKEKIINYLNIIKESSGKDGRKNLFTAMKYIEYSYFKEAEEVLQTNIDYNLNPSLSMRILGEVYLTKNDKNHFDGLLNKMVSKDNVRNQDALYLIGKMPDIKKINLMKNILINVDIDVNKSLFGKDDVKIIMPAKWILDDFGGLVASDHKPSGVMQKIKDTAGKYDLLSDESNNKDKGFIVLKFGKESYNPSSFQADENKSAAIFQFDGVVSFDEEIKTKKSFPVSIAVKHPTLSVDIFGELTERCEKVQKKTLDKGLDVAKSWKNKLFHSEATAAESNKKTVCNPYFKIHGIRTKNEEYLIKNDLFVQKRDF